MRENLPETICNFMLKAVPLFVSVLWIILALVPLRGEMSVNASPSVGLLCVFFWTIYRPDMFNLISVLLLGLFSDIISIAPLGLYLLMYLIMYLLVTNLIKYVNDKTFEILWIGLALLMPVPLLAGWLVMSVYYTAFLPIKSLLFSYLISVFIYPIIGGINALIVNGCLQDEGR